MFGATCLHSNPFKVVAIDVTTPEATTCCLHPAQTTAKAFARSFEVGSAPVHSLHVPWSSSSITVFRTDNAVSFASKEEVEARTITPICVMLHTHTHTHTCVRVSMPRARMLHCARARIHPIWSCDYEKLLYARFSRCVRGTKTALG